MKIGHSVIVTAAVLEVKGNKIRYSVSVANIQGITKQKSPNLFRSWGF